VVEIEYRVSPKKARLFYAVMQHVQLSRKRNGAYGWSIARDLADPELWTERYQCPTWHDYLRQRNRLTDSERALHQRANEFHVGPEPIRILLLPFNPVPKGGYFAFLGRISPEKRPDLAIEIALRAGARLKIAAKVDRADQAYWKNVIKPMIESSPNVEFVGEIGERDKGEFLGTRTPSFFQLIGLSHSDSL
jgi:glycosyltransferase involved in cell wall biosynthesis